MGELCFNFKRHRVPGPPASIPVTKCLRTRKYVPRCHNRSFFLLNVLYYCRRHVLSFRLPFSRYRVRELIRRSQQPFQFIHIIAWSKWKRKRRKLREKKWRFSISLPRFRPKKVRKIRLTTTYNEQLNYDWILEGSLFARGNLPHLPRSSSFLPGLACVSLVILPWLPRA